MSDLKAGFLIDCGKHGTNRAFPIGSCDMNCRNSVLQKLFALRVTLRQKIGQPSNTVQSQDTASL